MPAGGISRRCVPLSTSVCEAVLSRSKQYVHMFIHRFSRESGLNVGRCAACSVGALYQADCLVGDRLATCLFWDCAFRCIPALILETVWRGDEEGWGFGTAGRWQKGRERRSGKDSQGVMVGRSLGVWGIPGDTYTIQVVLRSSCQPAAISGSSRRSDTVKPVPQRALSLSLAMIFSFQVSAMTPEQR